MQLGGGSFIEIIKVSGNDEYFLLLYEFSGIDKYLQSKDLNVSSLDDLVKFSKANKDEVMQYFDQDILSK